MLGPPRDRLWPERVRAFVSTTGYTILNVPNLTKNMARVPDAACIEHVGLRLFLCPDGLVPDASRLLRHPACEQRDLPRCSDPASDSRLWAAQQIVECCAWDRAPPRFLIHDRDSRYGANFDRRVRGLGRPVQSHSLEDAPRPHSIVCNVGSNAYAPKVPRY